MPVISVNTGAQLAVDVGLLHHISQLEYSAVSSSRSLFTIFAPYMCNIGRGTSKYFFSALYFFLTRDLVPERG